MNIHNLSSAKLTPQQLSLLHLNLKYIPVCSPTWRETENELHKFTRRLLIKNIFKTSSPAPPFYLKNPAWQPPPSYFSRFLQDYICTAHAAYLKTSYNTPYKPSYGPNKLAKEIFERKDIVIKPTDKNLGPAILDIDWYIHQVMSHLQDTHTYLKIQDWQQELTDKNIINKYKHLVQNIVNHNMLEHQPGNKLKAYLLSMTDDFNIPPFYITPKVHKSPPASRPISASHSFFSTPLAHWVQHHLFKMMKRLPTVAKNSLDIRKKIKDLHIPDGALLITADVVALYPNINIQLGIQVIKEHILEHFPPDTAQLLLNALDFLLNNHYTVFDEVVYKQTCGTAMGVQFAPAYANIYIYFLFLSAYTKHKEYLILYKTYIDDLFWIWTGPKDVLDEFIRQLNNAAPLISLTVNISPSSVVFLDVVYTLHNNRLEYAPYSKPHNQHLYIPYTSNHPITNKKGWIKGELTRLARLSHNKTTYIHAAKQLYLHLLKRGYPSRFLDAVFTTMAYTRVHAQNTPKKPDNTTYLLIKYTPYLAAWNPLLLLYEMAQYYSLTPHQTTLIQNTCASWKTYPNLCKRLVRASLTPALERLCYHVQTNTTQ
jgi:hypothetical protein